MDPSIRASPQFCPQPQLPGYATAGPHSSFGNFIDPPPRIWKTVFRFNYTSDCTVSRKNFQKFTGEGHWGVHTASNLVHTPVSANSWIPRFGLRPQFFPQPQLPSYTTAGLLSGFGKFIDRPPRIWKTVFRFNYTPECTVSRTNFQKVSGEGLTEPPPQTPQNPPPLNLGLRPRFWLRPQFSGAPCPRFGLRPQFCPPTSTSWLRHWWPG